jgi:membrane fusion protein, multidrug efflux system
MNWYRTGLLLLTSAALGAQSLETVRVEQKAIQRQSHLPAELQPFLKVTVEARVNGFLERINVDRGSVVTAGQSLARLSAPELSARVAEAEAKVVDVASRKAEAEAKLIAARSTYSRLKEASQTPGAIAANELVVAEQEMHAAEAVVKSIDSSEQAAEAAVKPLRDLAAYLDVKAPFDGVVTERFVHPGALVGPGSGDQGLLQIEQVAKLRLVVAVPETEVAGIGVGRAIRFRVPAYPGREFEGVIARVPRALDPKTRSMPVEADVNNQRGELSPGMYAEVDWPVSPGRKSLLVPPTAVATTTEQTFVIRISGGKAEWVDVTKGAPAGDLLEVFGPLAPGDQIVKRATDEIRNGSQIAR